MREPRNGHVNLSSQVNTKHSLCATILLLLLLLLLQLLLPQYIKKIAANYTGHIIRLIIYSVVNSLIFNCDYILKERVSSPCITQLLLKDIPSRQIIRSYTISSAIQIATITLNQTSRLTSPLLQYNYPSIVGGPVSFNSHPKISDNELCCDSEAFPPPRIKELFCNEEESRNPLFNHNMTLIAAYRLIVFIDEQLPHYLNFGSIITLD